MSRIERVGGGGGGGGGAVVCLGGFEVWVSSTSTILGSRGSRRASRPLSANICICIYIVYIY